MSKFQRLAQTDKFWRSDRRGPKPTYRKQKRLDPGRKPKGAVTISDLQAMSPEKMEREFPEIWEQRKGKR